MRAALPVLAVALSLAACLLSRNAPAQGSALPVQPPAIQAEALPNAPVPSSIAAGEESSPPASGTQRLFPTAPTDSPFTIRNRFILETKTVFGPGAFIVPAGESLIIMAHPPHHYPREWADGGGAFARNYGSELVRHTTSGLTHFAVAAVVREDPRYHSSTSTNAAVRAFHALAFALVDRSDSGRHTLAISNLAGSAAGGFIGMAFLPDGFNDTTHAYQRSVREISNFGGHNLIAEFSPELGALARKLHFPGFVSTSFLPPDRKQP